MTGMNDTNAKGRALEMHPSFSSRDGDPAPGGAAPRAKRGFLGRPSVHLIEVEARAEADDARVENADDAQERRRPSSSRSSSPCRG